MKLVLSTLIVLTLAAFVVLVAKEDPGYIMINVGNWSIETNLVMLLVSLLVIFTLFYFLIRFLSNTASLPKKIAKWQSTRKSTKAHISQAKGLTALAQGHWQEAERQLIRHATHSQSPAINYLSAAKAAQQQGAIKRRDMYLNLAQKSSSDNGETVNITRAELLITEGQFTEALQVIKKAYKSDRKNKTVIVLLVKLYAELQDWERLLEWVPDLRKKNLLPSEEIDKMETNAFLHLLNIAFKLEGKQALLETWQRVPKSLKQTPRLVKHYVECLVQKGANTDAEDLLYRVMKTNWNEELIYLYGVISSGDTVIHYSKAKNIFHDKEPDSLILLTLGRLAKRNGNLDEALVYFERSLEVGIHPDCYQELADLYELQGNTHAALSYYRKGLNLSLDLPNLLGNEKNLTDSSDKQPLLSN